MIYFEKLKKLKQKNSNINDADVIASYKKFFSNYEENKDQIQLKDGNIIVKNSLVFIHYIDDDIDKLFIIIKNNINNNTIYTLRINPKNIEKSSALHESWYELWLILRDIKQILIEKEKELSTTFLKK